MRVLVTGATGFVGSHLAEELLRQRHDVRLLVREPQKLKWFDQQSFDIVQGDITNDESITAAVQGVDAVVHCAGVTKTARPEEFFQVNDAATRSLAAKCERAEVQRFVHCSTQAVCGPSGSEHRTTESEQELPITNYGKSKLAGEIAVREECKRVEWVILRPPSVMGPRDEQFLPLFKVMSSWNVYTEVGRATRRYSLIGVFDLVRALSLAVTTNHGLREAYFVAMPDPVEWSAVAKTFGAVTGKSLRRIVVPEFVSRLIGLFGDLSMKASGKPALLNSEKVREILATGWICNSSKIERAWDFHCQDSLLDVVRDTLAFYKDQKWI